MSLSVVQCDLDADHGGIDVSALRGQPVLRPDHLKCHPRDVSFSHHITYIRVHGAVECVREDTLSPQKEYQRGDRSQRHSERIVSVVIKRDPWSVPTKMQFLIGSTFNHSPSSSSKTGLASGFT
jgi:hypothetical protein